MNTPDLSDQLVRERESELLILDPSCVVCGGATGEVDSCCSLRCVEAAQRELHDNVGRLRRLGRGRDLAAIRALIGARNGRLSSALMQWRPSTGPHPYS